MSIQAIKDNNGRLWTKHGNGIDFSPLQPNTWIEVRGEKAGRVQPNGHFEEFGAGGTRCIDEDAYTALEVWVSLMPAPEPVNVPAGISAIKKTLEEIDSWARRPMNIQMDMDALRKVLSNGGALNMTSTGEGLDIKPYVTTPRSPSHHWNFKCRLNRVNIPRIYREMASLGVPYEQVSVEIQEYGKSRKYVRVTVHSGRA